MDKLLINEDVYDALIANANVKQNEGNQVLLKAKRTVTCVLTDTC